MYNVPSDVDLGKTNRFINSLDNLLLLISFVLQSGVVHADELFLMFTNKMFPPLTDPNDLKASNLLLDLWTSFATDG